MTTHLGDLVAPLVDGRLGHDMRDRVLAHTARCAACQYEVAAHRSLKARLSALGGPDLPPTLVERIVRLDAGDGGPFAGFSFPVAVAAGAEPTAETARDRRRVGRRTVLGSAAVVALAVGGGAAMTSAGDPAATGPEAPRPVTSVAAVHDVVPLVSPSWPALSAITRAGNTPPATGPSAVFGSVTVSFRH